METRQVQEPAALTALLRQFRSQRPLRGGSLLITLFGDAIAPRGGAVTLGSLIRLAAPFGLTERLVRTSVARLAREGWLTASRSGRHSEYCLSGAGSRRFATATRRIYGAGPKRWHGEWTFVLLPAALGAPRARRELRWLGFGQLAPLVLAHPDCALAQARAWLAELGNGRPMLLKSRSEGIAVDREIAARGWDLKDLARRYRRFLKRFATLEAAVRLPGLSPQAAFAVRTLLIHEYRKIHLQDPLLPPELLPGDWVGVSAYNLCRSLYGAVFAPAETYLSASAQRLGRPLPKLTVAARGRFGGVAAGASPAA